MADHRVGVTTPENMRMLLQTARWLRRHAIMMKAGLVTPPNFDEIERIHVFNDSGFEIPPWGLMQVVSTVEIGGENYVTVERPDGTTNKKFLFNDAFAIPDQDVGTAQGGPVFRVRTDASSSPSWGPEADEFFVTSGDVWSDIGPDDIGDGDSANVHRVVIGEDETTPQVYIAQATSSITARSSTTPGSGTASVQTSLSGSLALHSPTISLTVYNAYDVAISNGEYFIIVRDDIDQRWWAVPKGGTVAPTSKRVRGTIKIYPEPGNPFNAATASDPHTLENIEGIDAVWTGAATLSIYNPEGHKLWNDSECNVRCEYNETSGQWEVYSAQADRIVHGIRRLPNECKFEKLDGSDGWDNWDSNPGGLLDAEWVTFIYMDPADPCRLLFDTDCVQGELAATLDFVERVNWNEYTCELAVQYRCVDRVTYPGPFKLDFVKDVIYSEGSCELVVYGCEGVNSYPLEFVKNVTWSEANCTLLVTYCDNTVAALDMPNFVTNVEYNQDNCLLYVNYCQGNFEFFELDFVKEVSLSADNCNLIVSKCVSGDTEIQMPYVTDVYVMGDRMVYDTGCTSEVLIIEFTECD